MSRRVDPKRVSWRTGPTGARSITPSDRDHSSREWQGQRVGGGHGYYSPSGASQDYLYTDEESYYYDSREFDASPRRFDRHGYGYPRPSGVAQSYEAGTESMYESVEQYLPPGGGHRYGRASFRDSADYTSFRDSQDNRASIYSSQGFRDSADYYMLQPTRYRNAWERNQDDFYELGKELEQRGQDVPTWMANALARKEAADRQDEENMRASEAQWKRRLEATEKQMRDEQRKLRELAEERAKLEYERRRLQLHQERRRLVPETTYHPDPPPAVARWTEENREEMHKLALQRYNERAKERARARQINEKAQRQLDEEMERVAYEYDQEYYYLDKGDQTPYSRRATGVTLVKPTWDDVSRLRQQQKNRGRARKQGRLITVT